MTSEYSFKRLSEKDDISSFHCGDEAWQVEVSDFLKEDALIQQQQGLNVTWLCRLEGELVGYTSLVASRIELKSLFDWTAHLGLGEVKLRYVPCMLIGRFGVVFNAHGRGMGTSMLSFVRGAALTSSLGLRLLTLDVDKRNAKGLKFWTTRGFIVIWEGSDSRFMVSNLQREQTIQKGD